MRQYNFLNTVSVSTALTKYPLYQTGFWKYITFIINNIRKWKKILNKMTELLKV